RQLPAVSAAANCEKCRYGRGTNTTQRGKDVALRQYRARFSRDEIERFHRGPSSVTRQSTSFRERGRRWRSPRVSPHGNQGCNLRYGRLRRKGESLAGNNFPIVGA